MLATPGEIRRAFREAAKRLHPDRPGGPPEAFRKVLSTIGSFTNIRGGNAYPSLIRKTERKPLRVFLQDSSGDLDNQFGNWPIANQQMHAALKYMGYDVKFDFVEGFGHNSKRWKTVFAALKRIYAGVPPVGPILNQYAFQQLTLDALPDEAQEYLRAATESP